MIIGDGHDDDDDAYDAADADAAPPSASHPWYWLALCEFCRSALALGSTLGLDGFAI